MHFTKCRVGSTGRETGCILVFVRYDDVFFSNCRQRLPRPRTNENCKLKLRTYTYEYEHALLLENIIISHVEFLNYLERFGMSQFIMSFIISHRNTYDTWHECYTYCCFMWLYQRRVLVVTLSGVLFV